MSGTEGYVLVVGAVMEEVGTLGVVSETGDECDEQADMFDGDPGVDASSDEGILADNPVTWWVKGCDLYFWWTSSKSGKYPL